MDLNVKTTLEGSVCVVTVDGEVDLHTAGRLREGLVEAVAGGASDVLVDLAGVPFMDSTGLGALIVGLKRVKEGGGTLSLAGASRQVFRILEVTGLDRLLPIHDDVRQAVEVLERERAR